MGVRDFKRFDLIYTPYGAGIGKKTNGKYCEYADAEAREKELLAEKAALISELREIERRCTCDGDKLFDILAKYEAQ